MRLGNPVRLCEAALVLALLQGPAHALTHYVSPSGGHLPPFTNWVDAATNIQAAVDAADGGDTVLVDDGVYDLRAEVLIGTNITVESRRGPAATIVDGGGTTRCFRLVAGAGCVMRDLSVTNGMADRGGGVWMGPGNVLAGCVVAGCEAELGGGAYSSNAVISNCVFRGNTTGGVGGGMYSIDGSILDCLFEDNQAVMGGGLFVSPGGAGLSVDGCTFVDNAASAGGGMFCSPSWDVYVAVTNLAEMTYALVGSLGSVDVVASNILTALVELASGPERLPRPDPSVSPGCPEMLRVSWRPGPLSNVIRNCRAMGNTAMCGGGFYLFESPGVVVSSCLLEQNESGCGAGLCLVNGGTIAESAIIGNEAEWLCGGAFVHASGLMVNCRVASNTAAYMAGGCGVGLGEFLYALGHLDMHETRPQGTEARRVLGCEFVGNAAGMMGGGLMSEGNTAASNTFFKNTAQLGGGVAAQGDIVDSILVGNGAVIGAGVFVFRGNVCGCIARYNQADVMGGGIAAFPLNYGTSLSVEQCDVRNNFALGGGGIGLLNSATARACTVVSNTAGIAGGGVCSLLGGRIETSLVSQNAAANGGGVYCLGNGRVTSSTVTKNDALYAGGGLCVVTNGGRGMWYHDTNTVIGNSIIYGNAASNAANFLGPESNATYSYICTRPAVPGTGNITNDPQLTQSFRLGSSSPCVDAGNNDLMAFGIDLDGMPRPLDGDDDGTTIVDMGCYEHLNGAADSDGDTMPDGWEVEHGMSLLADDGDRDADCDSMDNRSEYVADTDPRDPNSVLAVVNVAAEQGGTRIDWKGGRDAWQFLECRSELGSSTGRWHAILAVPPPTPPTSAVIDLGAAGRSLFYRVRAER